MEDITDLPSVFNCSFESEIDEVDLSSNNTSSVTIDPAINFAFNGIGLLLLAILGISANLLSVVILSHPKLKSSLTTLLLGLTISDIFVIGTSFLIFSLSQVLQKANVLSSYKTFIRPHLLPWLLPIALTAQMSSLYFTVIITLERYIAVCLPLHARSLCTRSSAQKSAIVVVLVSILYNIPRWFEYQTISKSKCGEDDTIYTEAETEFRQGSAYILYYVNWGYLVVIYLVPFTILLYFNITIYRKAKAFRSRRNSLSPTLANNQNEDLQLAGMLFGIVITFIACNMLALVINVMESFGLGEIGNLIPINNFLIVLSSSTNFVFYFAFGTEFRKRLMRALTCKWDDDAERRKSSNVSFVMASVEMLTAAGFQEQQRRLSRSTSTVVSDDESNNNGNENC